MKAHVARIFAGVEAGLARLRATFPAGEVVLHFVYSGMAGRHSDRIEELARPAGRAVRVHPHANHQRLSEVVRARVPPHWDVMKPPAWVPQDECVRIVVWSLPPAPEVASVLGALETHLGCRVVLAQGD